MHAELSIPSGCFTLEAQAGFGGMGGVGADDVEDDFLGQR